MSSAMFSSTMVKWQIADIFLIKKHHDRSDAELPINKIQQRNKNKLTTNMKLGRSFCWPKSDEFLPITFQMKEFIQL